MALQVGSTCYALPADAGRAACSQFQPLTTISGNEVKTVTCTSADAVTGILNLAVSSTDISSNVTTSYAITQSLAYPPCIQQDYLDAIEILAGGLLALFIIWHGGWKMLAFVGWTRGEPQ